MSQQITARHSHRAWVSRGKLHVWGGCIEGQSAKFLMERHGDEVKRLTKSVEVFDVNGTREWTTKSTTGEDRPLGIRDAALALLGKDDTRAIFFGGYCGHGPCCFHNSLHELDTESWKWYPLIPDTDYHFDNLAPMKKRTAALSDLLSTERATCVCSPEWACIVPLSINLMQYIILSRGRVKVQQMNYTVRKSLAMIAKVCIVVVMMHGLLF